MSYKVFLYGVIFNAVLFALVLLCSPSDAAESAKSAVDVSRCEASVAEAIFEKPLTLEEDTKENRTFVSALTYYGLRNVKITLIDGRVCEIRAGNMSRNLSRNASFALAATLTTAETLSNAWNKIIGEEVANGPQKETSEHLEEFEDDMQMNPLFRRLLHLEDAEYVFTHDGVEDLSESTCSALSQILQRCHQVDVQLDPETSVSDLQVFKKLIHAGEGS